MTTDDTPILTKISDSQQSVSSPEEDVRGRRVTDAVGDDIGRVEDLLIDTSERKVRFLLVAHGGFLGFGETKSFIPVDAVVRITDEQVFIDQHAEHVAGAPAYDPELADLPDYYESVYGYYGVPPFWGPGYLYPAFPGRP
ncbi:PRC-barrel domain-containing protein [Streptomyces sp. SPB162]|uniref:PRC-barrel domain-containing protein n=1 Tax=Streptomyces sp. SPB162 TaxID=2940560 RepID=UPI002406677F|nr:PRC-barrel domain-containing protein [Streptomyces sp. SPB162]MDF9816685.1 sporulation protein YlmC with PRC-barrel domain [Streptomyces sp. SPB162]